MNEIQELEGRITAALERIGQAIDAMPVGVSMVDAVEVDERVATLNELLQSERDSNAQLAERLRALKERDAGEVEALQARVESLTRQLDAQGLEVKRMRKNVIQLRETMRALREAQAEGLQEPHLINRAMQAELEALRATRLSEMAEMDEILSELKPLIGDMQDA